MRYFTQASNAHVPGIDRRKDLLERLIARCRSGYFRRLITDNEPRT